MEGASISTPRPTGDAIRAALEVLARTQSEAGSWKGDYSGPLFLLPMYVGTCYAIGEMPPAEDCAGMRRYLASVQNADGGFGLGVENPSCVFTSVLCYVATRMLGAGPDDPCLARTREWFLPRGGALASASWGKFFLTLLRLHEYEGLHPVPPEMWLLPESLPVHPGRMWCHSRMVYLPMSWLYATRARIRDDALLSELRREIYAEPDYSRVDWRSARNRVAPEDAYVPRTRSLSLAQAAFGLFERRPVRRLRDKALRRVLELVRYEDEITSYVCLGPVNKLYDTLVWHFARPGGEEVRRHVERLPEYLYRDETGVRMNGYNSSELWDTAFALQAIEAAGERELRSDMAQRAFGYVERQQVREDPPAFERAYRHRSRGAWPFSTREHGWPITDCTGEGLKASILLEPHVDAPICRERLEDAVRWILRSQNESDGGWASYEPIRGPSWMETLNPSDIFSDIMVERSYPECTSACIQGLAAFRARYPGRMDAAIEGSMERARRFLLCSQRPDGSWEGSWAACFTYGTWFGVSGLAAAGVFGDHPAVRRACDFLERIQLPDGGWGEHVGSCRERRVVATDEGQAVQTAWAVMTLVEAGRGGSDAARRGVDFLLRRQRPDGTWPPEHIVGVFNRTCSIHYDSYLKVFPLWALALATREAL